MIDKIKVLALLGILDQCQGHMMPQKVLFYHINIELDAPLQESELIEQLRFAQDKGWIDYKIDEFKVHRWWITDPGQVELSKYR